MQTTLRPLTFMLSASLLAAWPAMAQHPSAMPEGPHEPNSQTAAGTDKPAMLGVMAERISDELRYQLPVIKPGAGLIIRRLVPGGPAAQAHMEPLDILLQWNDQLLVHPAQLQVLVQCAKPGDKVDVAYLHHGVLTKTQITLAEQTQAPAKRGRFLHPGGDAATTPAARLGELLASDAVRQAADALAKSGIDANAVASLLKGADLGKLDPARLDPAALLGAKIALVAPDGSRHEINLGDVMKANGNFGELLKSLDLGKSDPAALLGSKILLIGPDGRQKEINLTDLLKSGGALDDLLKGLGQPPAR